MARRRYRRSLQISLSIWLSHVEHEPDGSGELGPGIGFQRELLLSRARELVELRASVVVRRTPLGLDPSAPLEPVEGGVERSLRDLECGARHLMDPLGDGPPVLRGE